MNDMQRPADWPGSFWGAGRTKALSELVPGGLHALAVTSPRGEELDERGLAGNGCVGREATSASTTSKTHREMTHMVDGSEGVRISDLNS